MDTNNMILINKKQKQKHTQIYNKSTTTQNTSKYTNNIQEMQQITKQKNWPFHFQFLFCS